MIVCEHGRFLHTDGLGEPEICGTCPGPRQITEGMTAAAQCPLCGFHTATPLFERDRNGATWTKFECDACGFEYN